MALMRTPRMWFGVRPALATSECYLSGAKSAAMALAPPRGGLPSGAFLPACAPRGYRRALPVQRLPGRRGGPAGPSQPRRAVRGRPLPPAAALDVGLVLDVSASHSGAWERAHMACKARRRPLGRAHALCGQTRGPTGSSNAAGPKILILPLFCPPGGHVLGAVLRERRVHASSGGEARLHPRARRPLRRVRHPGR